MEGLGFVRSIGNADFLHIEIYECRDTGKMETTIS